MKKDNTTKILLGVVTLGLIAYLGVKLYDQNLLTQAQAQQQGAPPVPFGESLNEWEGN